MTTTSTSGACNGRTMNLNYTLYTLCCLKTLLKIHTHELGHQLSEGIVSTPSTLTSELKALHRARPIKLAHPWSLLMH